MTTILTVSAAGEQQSTTILTHKAFWASLAMEPLQRHPLPVGILPADRLEREQLDLTVPYGFLGVQRGFWAWSHPSGELEIQYPLPDGTVLSWVRRQTLGSVSTEKGGMKRGRYVFVDITDIPDWIRTAAEPYIKFPECGEVGVHRLLSALWFEVNLNPSGEETWHVHHKDHDTRNNQIDNLQTLPPALHALEHHDFRHGMAAYNSDGTVGSSSSKWTEDDFIKLHRFYAEGVYLWDAA